MRRKAVPRSLKDNLLKLIDRCIILELDSEVENLAEAYVKAGILPQKYLDSIGISFFGVVDMWDIV